MYTNFIKFIKESRLVETSSEYLRMLKEAGDPTDEGDEVDPEEFDDFEDEEADEGEGNESEGGEENEEDTGEKEDTEENEPKRREEVKPEDAPVFVDSNISLLKKNMQEYSQELNQQLLASDNDFVLNDVDIDSRSAGNVYTVVDAELDGYKIKVDIMAPLGSVVTDAENPNRITNVYVTMNVYTPDLEVLGTKIENRVEMKKLDAVYLQEMAREIISKKS